MNHAMPLKGLDFAVIAAYFAVTLAAGLFMGKFVKNAKDFFSGGKRVPWWMGAISSYMAMISCFVFIAYAQIGYEDGLVGVLVFWSTAAAIVLGTFVFWQRADVATPVEYLERRYGPGVRQVVSWCGVGFRILNNTVRLYTLGIIASQFLGISLARGIALGVAIVLVYSCMGGMWSVLVTDLIQCVVLLGFSLAVVPLALDAVGGLGALRAALPDHFSFFQGHRGTWTFLAAYYLIVFIKYNGEGSFIQRLTSVPSERDAVKMGLLTAATFLVFPVVAVLPAIAARAYLPDLPPELHERCYIEMCIRLLPPGALGLMVSAMLSASLSTLASEFNVTANVLTTDIYRRLFRPQAGERELLCLALGVTSGLLLKFLWTDLSWEAGTFIQVGVALAAFWIGALFGTSARERASREALFRQLNGAEKGSKK